MVSLNSNNTKDLMRVLPKLQNTEHILAFFAHAAGLEFGSFSPFLSSQLPRDNFFVSRRQLVCVQETTCFCRRQLLCAPETTFLSLLRPRDNLGDLTFVRQVSISRGARVPLGRAGASVSLGLLNSARGFTTR